MTTLSVPLTPRLEEFVERQVRSGHSPTKAHVVRRALQLLEEEEAVAAVLRSQQEMREGKILYGDLRKLAKKFE